MDFFVIFASIISTFIYFIVPFILIRFIYLRLLNRENNRIPLAVSSILLIVYFFFIFLEFFPRESFYTDNFEENTGLVLPNFKRQFNYAGNFTLYSFCDYNISYCYEFTERDYDDLYYRLLKKGLEEKMTYLETDENQKILSNNKTLKIKKILTRDFGFKNFEILFMNDNRTIIFNSNKN